MPRYDVHVNPSGPGYLLDCQSDLLDALATRFVVPLLAPEDAPLPSRRLNPILSLGGESLVMMTHFAGAVPRSILGEPVGSLAEQHDLVMNAFDMLLTGF